MIKKTTYFLFSVLLLNFISCTVEEPLPSKIGSITGVPLELTQIEGQPFDDGVFEAIIGETKSSVVVQNNTIHWMIPHIKPGDHTLRILYKEQEYQVAVTILQHKIMSAPKAYLLKTIEELALGITPLEVEQMTAAQQRTYAQYLNANYTQILSNASTNVHSQQLQISRKLAIRESVTLTVASKEKWNRSGIYALIGEEYEISASGSWTDWYIDTDANGYERWHLSLAGFLKRAPKENWFKLISAVDRQQYHPIGAANTITVTTEGELEFFANDILGFYWNNKGDISVRVTRIK
ncbi:hypothetical protein [Aquimarina brevivitae]|uniref:Uncharacterized protein n=1 Tax=Aquimarina brevivitae TaxID=323412 RepID=A0A4Q7P0D9_9FLAO|nr:hypothetical protein [Aquimarina brevivitae]RZS93145.1 hypothetical protein EV197_1715 [Aquimarina brevivitae]